MLIFQSSIDPYKVYSAIQQQQDIVIVDVRSIQDYVQGHIPTAISLPSSQYNQFNGSELEYPGLGKDVMNYVYCYESTCDSAIKACKKFASLGYKVKEIKGGFEQWQEYKLPVEK